MKIVPMTKVSFSRDHGFPAPYDATDEQLRSTEYVTELWPMCGPLLHVGNDKCIVVTFDELSRSFDEWEQVEDEEKYQTVLDWLRDCIDHGLHPCTIID